MCLFLTFSLFFSTRHRRMPGEQRRLWSLLQEHSGLLRVQLPERPQTSDWWEDVSRSVKVRSLVPRSVKNPLSRSEEAGKAQRPLNIESCSRLRRPRCRRLRGFLGQISRDNTHISHGRFWLGGKVTAFGKQLCYDMKSLGPEAEIEHLQHANFINKMQKQPKKGLALTN